MASEARKRTKGPRAQSWCGPQSRAPAPKACKVPCALMATPPSAIGDGLVAKPCLGFPAKVCMGPLLAPQSSSAGQKVEPVSGVTGGGGEGSAGGGGGGGAGGGGGGGGGDGVAGGGGGGGVA